VDQEGAEVGVAAFGDRAQMAIVPAGELFRDQAEERGETPARAEAGGRADKAEQSGRSQKADAGDGLETFGRGDFFGQGREPAIGEPDIFLEPSDLIAESQKHRMKLCGHTLASEGVGDGRQDTAGACGNRQSELAQDAAQNVQPSRPGGDPGRTRRVQSRQNMLADGLDRHGEDLLVAAGFQERVGIGAVGLVAEAVASDVMRRKKRDVVPEASICLAQ